MYTNENIGIPIMKAEMQSNDLTMHLRMKWRTCGICIFSKFNSCVWWSVQSARCAWALSTFYQIILHPLLLCAFTIFECTLDMSDECFYSENSTNRELFHAACCSISISKCHIRCFVQFIAHKIRIFIVYAHRSFAHMHVQTQKVVGEMGWDRKEWQFMG